MIKLLEGQRVIAEDGSTYLIEKDDFLKEANRGVAILPIDSINLVSGKNRILGNIFETWDGDDTTVEFWKNLDTGKLYLIITSGSKPLFDVGDNRDFIHDQNRRRLFSAEMIDYCLLQNLPKYASKYGVYLTTAYVYK